MPHRLFAGRLDDVINAIGAAGTAGTVGTLGWGVTAISDAVPGSQGAIWLPIISAVFAGLGYLLNMVLKHRRSRIAHENERLKAENDWLKLQLGMHGRNGKPDQPEGPP